MKILFISMPSIHAVRWIENLNGLNHDLYWFDVLGKGELGTKLPLHQFINWKKRKIPYIKGEHSLKRKFPFLYNSLQPFLEVTANEKLAQILNEIQPDVVHSFEMQNCSYPILETMQKFRKIKWLYSCWGSDLFYYKNMPNHILKIKSILNRINYLHTDCQRDYLIAKSLGFTGKHAGVIPGGAGYRLGKLENYKVSIEKRKIILIKGYENLFGRALNVIKAIKKSDINLNEYEIIVFGAHLGVQNYIKENNLDIKVHGRHDLSHLELIKLMGKSLIYIGNNISDGMPNTLLEAIVMGAFPLQSNPGGVTAEVITNGINGYLIENPNDEKAIATLILQVLKDPELLQSAFDSNKIIAKERLDYTVNQQKIVVLYKQIENDLCE